jgi:hypothetical protein
MIPARRASFGVHLGNSNLLKNWQRLNGITYAPRTTYQANRPPREGPPTRTTGNGYFDNFNILKNGKDWVIVHDIHSCTIAFVTFTFQGGKIQALSSPSILRTPGSRADNSYVTPLSEGCYGQTFFKYSSRETTDTTARRRAFGNSLAAVAPALSVMVMA